MGLRERPGARGLHLSAAHCRLQRWGEWDHWLRLVKELSCVNNNSRFSRGKALRLGVSDCAIDEKRYTNEMLRVPVYSGVLKLCWGLNFGYDDGQTCRFCNRNVGLRFDLFQVGCETDARFMLGVYSLQNLVFLTASRHIPCWYPGAEIRWGWESAQVG